METLITAYFGLLWGLRFADIARPWKVLGSMWLELLFGAVRTVSGNHREVHAADFLLACGKAQFLEALADERGWHTSNSTKKSGSGYTGLDSCSGADLQNEQMDFDILSFLTSEFAGWAQLFQVLHLHGSSPSPLARRFVDGNSILQLVVAGGGGKMKKAIPKTTVLPTNGFGSECDSNSSSTSSESSDSSSDEDSDEQPLMSLVPASSSKAAASKAKGKAKAKGRPKTNKSKTPRTEGTAFSWVLERQIRSADDAMAELLAEATKNCDSEEIDTTAETSGCRTGGKHIYGDVDGVRLFLNTFRTSKANSLPEMIPSLQSVLVAMYVPSLAKISAGKAKTIAQRCHSMVDSGPSNK